MSRKDPPPPSRPADPESRDGEAAASPAPAQQPSRLHLTGLGVSAGIAIGHVYVLDRGQVHFPKRHIAPAEVAGELERLQNALDQSVAQLQAMQDRVRLPLGEDHTLILHAHVLMLKDPHLLDSARHAIRADLQNAEWALRRAVASVKQTFDSLSDEYFRERRSDIDFVVDRVLRNLTGRQTDVPEALPVDAIVVAHDLSPADTLSLARQRLRGFVTEVGGPTSHTAILARALSIPAVVGAVGASELVASGDPVIVDGGKGEVLVHPGRLVLAKYRGIRRQHELAAEELGSLREAPAVTLDGRHLRLTANIELDEEAATVLQCGAEGVGLYRTEYLFLHHRRAPTVEEHQASYQAVATGLAGRPATIRTFDLGGDKLLPGGQIVGEQTEPGGLRAIRLALKEAPIMRTQLEGILRATPHGPLRVMLPMVGSVEELRDVKAMLEEVKYRLRQQSVPFEERLPLGVMIELPSAVWVADHLARECDFFSVGTNDLIQYSLAVDRHNEHMAPLYEPLHPGVLRALNHVVKAAHAAGIRVSMCGEMAADTAFTGVLLGLELDELSTPALAVPRVKHVVRHWKQAEAVRMVQACLDCPTAQDVRAVVAAHQPEIDPHPAPPRPALAAGSA